MASREVVVTLSPHRGARPSTAAASSSLQRPVEEPLIRCLGCHLLRMNTIPSIYVPIEGESIQCELCPLCYQRMELGDRRLGELIEFRLLLWA
jgi:hypothetical protein